MRRSPSLRTAASAAALIVAASSLAQAGAASADEAPKVVASIKPIHSLVAAVMEGVGEPTLIVDGAGSPHTYSMKPSNASDLESADVVFWAGDGLESFLVKPIETLATKARVVELVDSPGLEKLRFRESGAFEAHADEAEGESEEHAHEAQEHAAGAGHDGHEHGGYDMHFWLDPENAKAMVGEIETVLAAADPPNAATYKANADRLDARLDTLVETTRTELEGVKGRPFVVFHDAYHYYERRFGVTAAGSITVSPETLPGVQRIGEIQAKVRQLGATCVFAEPQFEPKLVTVVTEGTDARTGILDPEGAGLANGPNLYFELIDALTASLKDCLSGQS